MATRRPVKKKKKKLSDARFNKAIDHLIEDLEEQSNKRAKRGKRLMKKADAKTRQTAEEMVEVFQRMAGTPHAIVRIDGYEPFKVRIPERVQEKDFSYIAARVMAGLAEWDIQMANYIPPKDACVKCGRKHG